MKKIGLIGAGMIGDVHIDSIRKEGRGEVTWIATRTERTLREKVKKWGITRATTDYREMLRDKSLDAVIIASPQYTHYPMLKDALQAGKHVLLEKPMAAKRQDLEPMLDLVAKHPDLAVIDCSCRHARLQPKFKFIRDLIDNGAIGKVYHIHHNALTRGTYIEWNPAGTWAHQKELAGGGPFYDLGVYDLSFHLGILHDIPRLVSVRSFMTRGIKPFPPGFVSDIEEHGAAWLEFDTGMTYYYERGNGAQIEIPNETRIFGTTGSLRFGFWSYDPPEVEYYYVENGEEKHRTLRVEVPPEHEDNLEMARHFMDVLIDGAKPQMPLELAAKHADILLRIMDA